MKSNRISGKVKAIILSGVILGSTSLSNIASADTLETNVANDNIPINIMSEGNKDVKIKEITRDQYVQNIAKNEGITIEEADKIATEKTEKALEGINKMPMMKKKSMASIDKNIVWRQASWVQTYSKNKSFKAEMDASFEVWSSGSFRQINSCSVGSSLAAGQHSAKWVQSNSWKTTKFPTLNATVGVTGKFYTTVMTGGSMSLSIPGFSVSGTGSTSKTFASSNMTIQKQWGVY